jgi:sugar lactone lactonase YvrE
VWIIPRAGGEVGPNDVFRLPPSRNGSAGGGRVAGDGIGRQVRRIPPGTITPANTAGGQEVVPNGIAFDRKGDLFISDSFRGAIWKVEVDPRGDPMLRQGCDTTFNERVLCFSHLLVQHPLLEGADGIAIDREGNILVVSIERNAIVVVTPDGRVAELFRNPPDGTSFLRSNGPLEGPASIAIVGRRLFVSEIDIDTRDNSPPSGGALFPNGPRGRISVMVPDLPIAGLGLPVR